MNQMETILSEVSTVLKRIDNQEIDAAVRKLQEGRRIFVIGEGRSGLMAKSFAMRLMHLGAEVYVIGETITPSITETDILVAVSGSGTTKNVVWTTEKAQSMGCSIIAVTTDTDSPLGSHASLVIHVPAATKYRKEWEPATIQPLGSLFDQCVHILFDNICLAYAASKQVNHEQAFQKHSNME
ncbi:6-phospho-3-hexuloisomerase [Peribacillus cavernae]|uniref:6-phospho-3-hexuloisomerase n=1 Tax=Peribacillus cavernae TaxID=1674310 RepID=A0A3S0VXZ1_9BACI|nr:6-phospho-3-hexuloisomerase [Peribacillus cavernae]MDQ0219190.1 6-phospho-3-hexuloisomerase [Peribacillus cavernae]RUQ28588.1 6-phospho-3-hexuloisomerase [Peribacillus cavernae]